MSLSTGRSSSLTGAVSQVSRERQRQEALDEGPGALVCKLPGKRSDGPHPTGGERNSPASGPVQAA